MTLHEAGTFVGARGCAQPSGFPCRFWCPGFACARAHRTESCALQSCWSHPIFCQENKEGAHFFFKPAGKSPRFVRAVPIQSDKWAKPCIKRPPLSNSRWDFGHPYQALQLLCAPLAKAREFRICALRQAAGLADKMCQTGLRLCGEIPSGEKGL